MKTWIAACAVAFVLAYSYRLDGPVHPHLDEAQVLCSRINGPNTGYFYDASGKLVCTDKHGRKTNQHKGTHDTN